MSNNSIPPSVQALEKLEYELRMQVQNVRSGKGVTPEFESALVTALQSVETIDADLVDYIKPDIAPVASQEAHPGLRNTNIRKAERCLRLLRSLNSAGILPEVAI